MPDGMPRLEPDVIANRVGIMLTQRRPGAAKPLLAALAKLAPDHGSLPLLRSAYYCQIDDFPEAIAVLSQALELQPADAGLWLRRADIFFTRDDFAESARNAATAVVLAPDMIAAKSRLGLALLKLGQYDDALSCLTECFSTYPAGVEVALAVAALSPSTAIETLTGAIAASPQIPVLRNALARLYLSTNNIPKAMHIARQACTDGLADAETFCLLSFCHMEEASWDEANVTAAQAHSFIARNAWASRLAAALSDRLSGHLQSAVEPNADLAELTLISGGTIIPGAYRIIIQQSKLIGPVLDIYCGTGLNAVAMHDLDIGAWTGIDRSAALLLRCAERGLYASLDQTDRMPESFASIAKYPLILLNEVLAHEASLASWFGLLSTQLARNGIALAAIPTGRSGLTGHGLFAHSLESIAEQASRAGLSFTATRTGVLRYLEGIPLRGVIATLQVS